MNRTEQKIRRGLEAAFTEHGFAELGVDALRDAADVSLRTLYKYYPSREAMVVAALEQRHQSYLAWLGNGPDHGAPAVLHVYRRLGDWLANLPSRGCLFLNAQAAYPDNAAVKTVLRDHKREMRSLFAKYLTGHVAEAEIEPLSLALLVLHEGQTEAAVYQSPEAVTEATLRSAKALLNQEGNA